MKVYFTASVAGKIQYLSNYLKIIATLKKFGNEVISEHIIDTTTNQLRTEKKDDRLEFQEKLDNWIHNCDCVVAEVSYPSISVGFEISLALNHSKPVLLLYSGQTKPPSLLAQYKSENLICENYFDDDIGRTLEDFISYVKNNNDTRFTFFITPQISAFLEKVAKKERLPKSVYLRKLIEKEMD